MTAAPAEPIPGLPDPPDLETLAPGAPGRRPSGQAHSPANKRGPVGSILRLVLGPVFYWLDLYDYRSGKPDHWKVLATVGYLFGLVLIALVTRHAFSVHDGDVPTFELAWIGGYSALVFLVPYGMKGIKLWLDWKGSQVDLTDLGKSEIAAIAARRASSAHPGTEPAP